MAFRISRDIHTIVKENLSAYIDGEADPKSIRLVEQHLASCAECAYEKETLEQTRALVRQVPQVAAPRSFILRPAQVEAEPKRANPLVMLYLRGATVIAGVLLFAVVAGDVWVRPAITPAAESTQKVATFGMEAAPTPTEDGSPRAAAVPAPAQAEPEGTPPQGMSEATSEAQATPRGLGGGAVVEETPTLADSSAEVVERGESARPFWADTRLWRAAEGVLGAMFLALVAVVVIGARGAAHQT